MTTIAWCDETWNPLLGCSRQGPGCDNCYAMLFMHRNLRPEHRGLTILRPASHARPGVDWSGEVRMLPERLALPFTWRKPARIFTTSASDPFHPRVPFEYVAAIFGIVAATPWLTHLMLTKQPDRARAFFRWYEGTSGAGASSIAALYEARSQLDKHASDTAHAVDRVQLSLRSPPPWPLPNLHLGVSVEDKRRADERIPELLACSNALPWISAEPLLEGFSIAPWLDRPGRRGLRWVVVGGESGRRARRYRVEWARDMIRECQNAGVAVFHKQLGAQPEAIDYPGGYLPLRLVDKKGEDPAEWPEGLDVRQWPTTIGRVA